MHNNTSKKELSPLSTFLMRVLWLLYTSAAHCLKLLDATLWPAELETMSEQSQLPIDVYTELGKRYRKELPSLWPKKTTSKDSAHASQGKNEDAGRKKRKSAKEGGRAKKRTMVIEDSEEEGPTSSPLPVVAIAAVGAASVGGG
ncbi:hypothetical protein B0H65DRAFT_545591 [Neurospora tetraspora]|uniref:Uncharacterized protein n=1 Tax=Neurospora tetraspora TaxID=94610 RepID=A0AAE0MTJ7_9PEZI|nr:hypothetical protein B0H65DRAFT_545591 [Neurospora tetraspora]